ncbi:MAG: AAA family ATPase, partial [Deltaproteobacteria bacterium]|nr:AAA family ATPase [Deltaproteobacteria bacterium]
NAHFRFVDATAAAVVHGEARAALSEIVGKDNSYLRVWSEYHERESQVILGQAMDFGALEYVSTHQRVEDDGWSFELVPSPEIDQRIQQLKDLGRVELIASEEEPSVDSEGKWRGVKVDKQTLSAPVLSWRRREGLLDLVPPTAAEPQPPPPDVGYLSLSLSGDIMRLARRKQAEEALRSGQVEIPQLGLLMEGRPAPMSRRPPIHLDTPSLKRALREAFGGGRPTPRQLWAIEVALNTPDLCLIQGPPGTGKTKVITAIQHCLAALAEKGKEVSNQVLVTAAQHDAVENVAARSKIFGLPAMKVGRRRGAREEEGVSNITRLFSAERVEALRATLRVTPLTARLDEVRSAVINAQLSKGTPAEHAARLREVLRLLRTPEPLVDLSPGLAERIASCATELERAAIGGGDAEELARRVKSTRAVRVTPSTFADDGPLRARAALLGLDALLSPALRAFLERCAAVDLEEEQEEAARRGVAVEEALVWVQEGASLRDALLDELTQPPAQPVAPLNDETHEALKGLLGALVTLLKRSRLGELGVIADYIEALESDLPLLQSTLEEYTFTLAATLQQAAGRAMRDAVGVETGTPFFDSVIVDEAARAHPLDLFIPLSMAKRRVALVGDHRQLPHLLEPDVERLLVREVEEGSVSEETLKAVRASLFS